MWGVAMISRARGDKPRGDLRTKETVELTNWKTPRRNERRGLCEADAISYPLIREKCAVKQDSMLVRDHIFFFRALVVYNLP